MSTGAGKIVCVTGASGYIASWIVKLLLSRGYTVKASVRDPSESLTRSLYHPFPLRGFFLFFLFFVAFDIRYGSLCYLIARIKRYSFLNDGNLVL
jgi:hypothetical protein